MHAEDDASTSPLRPIVSVRYTTVAADAAVLETTAGALYQVAEPIQLGVLVPMVSVSQAGERTTGLGNIVTFVNGTILPAPQAVVLNAGLQLEVPTVSDPALGDGHFLLMPTLQAGWHPGNGIVMATVGWGRVLDGAHNHDHDAHGHGEHDHGEQDHGNHDFGKHDHGKHDHGEHDHGQHHGEHDHTQYHDDHDHMHASSRRARPRTTSYHRRLAYDDLGYSYMSIIYEPEYDHMLASI